MYESHFLLTQRPFGAAPRANMYIPTGSLEQARQTLTRCIDRAEGPGLVVGPAGTGKSLVCQILADHFCSRFQVAQLAGARLSTRRALLQNILFELKLRFRDMDEGELCLSLVDHLEPRPGGPEGLLLLVDEAHTLPLRLLDEIRLLTNIARDGQSRVRLVLAGGMALEERLASPKLESFQQRIAARCYLQPLGRDETIYYVQEQVRRCGASADDIFTGDAQAAIHTATDGIPRLINQVCDHVLLLAAMGGQQQIDASGIEEAWADLQQLPLPLHEPPSLAGSGSGTASGMVEFGQLGDSEEAGAGTVCPDVAFATVHSDVANATVAKLDSISRTLDALHGPGQTLRAAEAFAADDFSPAVANGTEVELYFHGSHDPFGGNWEEEEVVIDRYASLEDAAVRCRRVTSEEGRAFGAAISAAAGDVFERDPAPQNRMESFRGADCDDDRAGAFATDQSLELPGGSGPAVAFSLRSVDQDDRDMIVVDDEQRGRSSEKSSQPRRPDYRQLFSQLRGK